MTGDQTVWQQLAKIENELKMTSWEVTLHKVHMTSVSKRPTNTIHALLQGHQFLQWKCMYLH